MGIDKRSRAYSFLKAYVDFWFKRFYKVSWVGKDSVKLNERLIFAPNHQNALMDALAVHASFPLQLVFLARSDIFSNKTVAKILYFLKLLPVYRIRDGYDQLVNNEESFQQTFDLLDNNTPLAILPEGNHEGKKKLRPLKKGIARIAFSYRHDSEEKKDIHIVPTGLNFFSYHKPGAPLLIIFGEPIAIADFDTEYLESPAKATNAFIKSLENALKEIILHIDDESVYDTIEALTELYAAIALKRKQTTQDIFFQQKGIIKNLESIHTTHPGKFENIRSVIDELQWQLTAKKLDLLDIGLLFSKFSRLRFYLGYGAVLISLPLYLFAFLQNLLPSLLLNNILSKFKDPHFKSSVLLVGTIFIFPLFHALQTLVFGIITGSVVWTSLYLASLPLSFIFKYHWEKLWNNLQKRHRISPMRHTLVTSLQKLEKLTGFRLR